jgi:hypothetical protein
MAGFLVAQGALPRNTRFRYEFFSNKTGRCASLSLGSTADSSAFSTIGTHAREQRCSSYSTPNVTSRRTSYLTPQPSVLFLDRTTHNFSTLTSPPPLPMAKPMPMPMPTTSSSISGPGGSCHGIIPLFVVCLPSSSTPSHSRYLQ